MKHSLRKTPCHLHLAYKYGEPAGGLLGRNLVLETQGHVLTLEIDAEANLRSRNKNSAWYVAASNFLRNRHKLKSLQCPDNLVRARLIRAWEQVAQPQLRLLLDLGAAGRFLYDVAPHSLFMGGVQLDVRAFLEELEPAEHAHALAGESDEHNHHA
jgi:hypothetical protein